ncbi:unnamed protein product [Symbiodinium natans]|uniref:Uncharacterized protein n=1 Tax=Symbiodinium natans TaxID=878477 RepID=A0A812TBU6_9DINO|nr:unnamed protein product [Symbiodinium natans]
MPESIRRDANMRPTTARGTSPNSGTPVQEPLPSDYLLGSPKSQRSGRSGRSPSQRSRSAAGSPKSPKSPKAHRAWKAANPELEVLSVEELQKLLQLKDHALELLQEEVAGLQAVLESQERLEVRYRHLQSLLQPAPDSEKVRPVTPSMLDKIGEAGRAAQVDRLHAYHAGLRHGYTDFEAKAVAFPVDELGMQKRGMQQVSAPTPDVQPQPRQVKGWLY